VSEKLITGAEFSRFLEAKGVTDDCPACGTKEGMSISVYDPGESLEGEAPAVRMVRRLDSNPARGYGEFLQACVNCGFLRYFRDIEVLAFLEEEDDNG